MAAEFEFTVGATRPFFAIIVKNELTNAAVDLTGATVRFFFADEKMLENPVVNGVTATITDATAGKVEHRWGASDLPRPGTYTAIFEIEHTDLKKQPVRIEGVLVKPKLGT